MGRLSELFCCACLRSRKRRSPQAYSSGEKRRRKDSMRRRWSGRRHPVVGAPHRLHAPRLGTVHRDHCPRACWRRTVESLGRGCITVLAPISEAPRDGFPPLNQTIGRPERENSHSTFFPHKDYRVELSKSLFHFWTTCSEIKK